MVSWPWSRVAELGRDALDVAGIHQHAIHHVGQLLPRLGEAEQALALADEQFEPELVFEILDVFRDTRLGGEQRVGHLGQVEIAAHRLVDDAQLLKVHQISQFGAGAAALGPVSLRSKTRSLRRLPDARSWPSWRPSRATSSRVISTS
jgi:hypothetical protein